MTGARALHGRLRVAALALGIAITGAACQPVVNGGGSGTAPVVVAGADHAQTNPAAFGDTIVWEDHRDDESGRGVDVYRTTIGAAGTGDLVAGGNGDQEEPAVSDRWIVWIDRGRLRAMDRTTGSVTNVAGGPTQSSPVLCGDVVVWADSRHPTSAIYARDLSGGAEIPVAATSATEAYPACDGHRIAYMTTPPGFWSRIDLYDLGTGQRTTVSDLMWNAWRPTVSGDIVAWQWWPDQPAGTIQIRGVDLSTGARFTVAESSRNQVKPLASGRLVVWEESVGGSPRLFWRNLDSATGPHLVAPALEGRQTGAALSGNRVVFQGDASGQWDLYTRLLPVSP